MCLRPYACRQVALPSAFSRTCCNWLEEDVRNPRAFGYRQVVAWSLHRRSRRLVTCDIERTLHYYSTKRWNPFSVHYRIIMSVKTNTVSDICILIVFDKYNMSPRNLASLLSSCYINNGLLSAVNWQSYSGRQVITNKRVLVRVILLPKEIGF
jgi:hypothetical protein